MARKKWVIRIEEQVKQPLNLKGNTACKARCMSQPLVPPSSSGCKAPSLRKVPVLASPECKESAERAQAVQWP